MQREWRKHQDRADREVRVIHTRDGVDWDVYEFAGGDGAVDTSLIFERVDAVRRVRVYPPDWADLPDEELIALMKQRPTTRSPRSR